MNDAAPRSSNFCFFSSRILGITSSAKNQVGIEANGNAKATCLVGYASSCSCINSETGIRWNVDFRSPFSGLTALGPKIDLSLTFSGRNPISTKSTFRERVTSIWHSSNLSAQKKLIDNETSGKRRRKIEKLSQLFFLHS